MIRFPKNVWMEGWTRTVIPPFMFRAFSSEKVLIIVSVLIEAIKLTQKYTEANLSKQGSNELFVQCYPIFQAIWFWDSKFYASDMHYHYGERE